MPKLKLRMDELAVESFDTLAAGRTPGTVLGHETEMMTCDPFACGGESQVQTCGQWATCEGALTCNFMTNCYTWAQPIHTCVGDESCNPTHDHPTCPQP